MYKIFSYFLVFSTFAQANIVESISEYTPYLNPCNGVRYIQNSVIGGLAENQVSNLQDYMTEQGLGQLVSAGRFFWKRVPRCDEALLQTSLTAGVEVVASPLLEKFGSVEAAKSVVRDIAISPSVAANVYIGGKIAGSDYTYDGSHLEAQSTKIVTKLGATWGLMKLGVEPTKAGKLATCPGDFFGRYFVNQGRFYQDQDRNLTDDKKRGVLDYMSNETFYLDPINAASTAAQATPNTFLMAKLNDVINNDNGPLANLVGIKGLNQKKELVNQGLLSAISSGVIRFLNIGLPQTDATLSVYSQNNKPIAFLVLWTGRFVARTITTYIIAPISQTFMDGTRDTLLLIANVTQEIKTGSGQDD